MYIEWVSVVFSNNLYTQPGICCFVLGDATMNVFREAVQRQIQDEVNRLPSWNYTRAQFSYNLPLNAFFIGLAMLWSIHFILKYNDPRA